MQNEVGMSEEQARKLVSKVNKNQDGKIAQQELVDLHNQVKEQ